MGGREGRGSVLGGYIYTQVTPVQPGKHGDIPELFLWLVLFPIINIHSVAGISHFFIVLF